MQNLTNTTLGELLSHTNTTIRRNAISIYKTLIALDKKIHDHFIVKDGYGKEYCQECGKYNNLS